MPAGRRRQRLSGAFEHCRGFGRCLYIQRLRSRRGLGSRQSHGTGSVSCWYAVMTSPLITSNAATPQVNPQLQRQRETVNRRVCTHLSGVSTPCVTPLDQRIRYLSLTRLTRAATTSLNGFSVSKDGDRAAQYTDFWRLATIYVRTDTRKRFA